MTLIIGRKGISGYSKTGKNSPILQLITFCLSSPIKVKNPDADSPRIQCNFLSYFSDRIGISVQLGKLSLTQPFVI
jgi:hypothetical protein